MCFLAICNDIYEEERADYFALIVFPIPRDCLCSAVLPDGALG